MSASIEASLRLEIAQYQASLAKAQGDFKSFKERITREGAGLGRAAFGGMQNSAGKGGKSNLGGMAMQAQDIAVQLQAGTHASIVLAQQGSQLLSVFGTGGALLGGAIAIGGAFYMMGQKATEAFTKAKSEAASFDGELQTAMAGNSGQIAEFWAKVGQNIRGAYTELESLNNGWSAIGAQIADIFGGPSVEDRARVANEQRIKQENALIQIQQRLLEMSAAETEIARLRNAGEKEKADEMERQLDLARKLAQIQGTSLPQDVKDRLAADASAQSAYGANNLQDPKKTAEEAARLEEKMRAEKLAALDPQERMLELSRQEEAIYASMATKGGLFFDQSMQGLEAWAEAKKKAGDMSGYVEVLKMIDKARQLQEQIAGAQKEITADRDKRDQQADARRAEIDAVKQKMAEEQDRFAETFKQQQAAKQSLKEELMLLQAKAAGNDDLVAQMERELRIREKAKQIQEQTNVSEQQARSAAEKMVALEEQAARANAAPTAVESAGDPARPGHIGGVKRRRYMQSGSDEFRRNQMRDGSSATAIGANGLSGRRDSAIPGRFMGGADMGAISDRARRNADAADARGNRDTGAMDLGGKIFEILQRNLE